MTVPVKIDQVNQGLDRLLEQFKNKPNIKGQLTTYLSQNNDIEATTLDIIKSRSIDTSVGIQLDQIGALVGQPRNGLTDVNYRTQIKFKIAVNNSNGTPEEIINMLYDVTGSTEVRYFEHYPASYMISYNGSNTPNDMLSYIQAASPVCVNLGIMHDQNNKGWVPAEIGATGTKAARGVLPETNDTVGYIPPEIYIKNPIRSTAIATLDLTTCFNSQLVVGTGGTQDIDVGFDLSDNKTFSLVKCISGASCYEEFISPLMDTNKFKRMGKTTSSIGTGASITYNGSVITLGDGTTGTEDRFNIALDAISINTFRQKEGFCDIIKYTGDGNINRVINHTLNKDVGSIIVVPLSDADDLYNVFWFKGMTNKEYISHTGIVEDSSIWSSILPTKDYITVGKSTGSYDVNKNGKDYILILFADNPENGITVGEYVSTGEIAHKVDTPFQVGYSHIRGASQIEPAVFDYKSTPSRARIWSTTSNSTDTDLLFSVDSSGIKLGTSAITNSNSGTGRYFYLAIKNPEGAPVTQKVIPNLNDNFSVDLYQGNSSNNTITNGLDLLNEDGLVFSWGLNNSTYVRNYSPVYDTGAINQFGVKGYKNWLSNNASFYVLRELNYLSNGFSMGASTTDWNGSGIDYLAMCIKQATGFMQIIPYTGDGTARQEVAHTLSSGVALLIVCSLDPGRPNANMWIKGMPNDKVLTYTTTATVGAIWGGSTPTDNIFTVGDIGGGFNNMNRSGRDYVAYIFADDPNVGITCGSYVATGTEGQEVDIGNQVGMLMVRQDSQGFGCINTYKTGTKSKPFNYSTPVSNLISAIDVDNKKIRLATQNSYTNDNGKTHYWFNIAKPII